MACVALALVLAPSVVPSVVWAGAAGPKLTLPASWYEIVAPYDYDEARRFEAGQRRGAGVRTAGGIVRSPVAGTVRYSGTVAGRAVTTIDTTIDGQAAVVTFTGGRGRALRVGSPVSVGDVVGVGARVHVGAYDPARRSRYLPVVASTGRSVASAPPTANGGVPAREGRGSPIGAAVGDRLVELVSGVIRPSGPSGAAAGVRSRPPTEAGARRRGAAVVRVRQPGGSASSGVRRITSTRVPLGSIIAGVRRGPERDRTHQRRARKDGHGNPDAMTTASQDPERRDPDERQRSSEAGRMAGVADDRDGAGAHVGQGRGRGSRAAGQVTSGPRTGRDAAGDVAAVDVAAVSDAPITSDDVEQLLVRASDAETGSAQLPAMRAPLAIVLGALLASIVGVAWGRRRRRIGWDEGRPIAAALPVHLHVPSVGPYAYPVGDTEGASILPDVGLAWCEPDPGTDDAFQPPASAHVREPEHA